MPVHYHAYGSSSLSASSISSGGNTILYWDIIYGIYTLDIYNISAYISWPGGSWSGSLGDTSGSFTLYPSSTGTIDITLSWTEDGMDQYDNPYTVAGNYSSSYSITVTGGGTTYNPAVNSFTISSNNVYNGDVVYLSWSCNSDTNSISSNFGYSSTSGSNIAVYPSSNTTTYYTITPYHDSQAGIPVTVSVTTTAAPVYSFSISSPVSNTTVGDNFTISQSISGYTNYTLSWVAYYNSGGTHYVSAPGSNGNWTVGDYGSSSGNTVYVYANLYINGVYQTSSNTVAVNVWSDITINSFYPSASTVTSNATFQLNYSYNYATSASITYSGGSVNMDSATLSAPITANWTTGTSRTYTLSISNGAGKTKTATTSVLIATTAAISGTITVSKYSQIYFGRDLTISTNFTRNSNTLYSIVTAYNIGGTYYNTNILDADTPYWITPSHSIPTNGTYTVKALGNCIYRIKAEDQYGGISYLDSSAVTVYGKVFNAEVLRPRTILSITTSNNYYNYSGTNNLQWSDGNESTYMYLYGQSNNSTRESGGVTIKIGGWDTRQRKWSYGKVSLRALSSTTTGSDNGDEYANVWPGYANAYLQKLDGTTLYTFNTNNSYDSCYIDSAMYDAGLQIVVEAGASAAQWPDGWNPPGDSTGGLYLYEVYVEGFGHANPPNGFKSVGLL